MKSLLLGVLLILTPVSASIEILQITENKPLTVIIENRPFDVAVGPGFPSSLTADKALAAELLGVDDRGHIDAQKNRVVIKRATAARICPLWVSGDSRYLAISWPSPIPEASDRIANADEVMGRQELAWYDSDEVGDTRLIAGPFAVPAPRIGFQIGKASASDSTVDFTLDNRSRWEPATITIPIGADKIPVRFIFAPHLPHSIATAAAGSAIARAYGGKFAGPVEQVSVAQGVRRPARLVRLDSPLKLGEMKMHNMLVRPADCGSTTAIQEESAPKDMPAADDIVVTGNKSREPSWYALVYLGKDALVGCSYLLFDKASKKVSLTCARD